MQVKNNIQQVFVQISETLNQLSGEQYTAPSLQLNKATIGQHVRHIIELFQCLENGYESGVVNYEKRKRDTKIENDKDFAGSLLHDIFNNLERPDRELILEANYDEHSTEQLQVKTNYMRELIYNLEHVFHHMALIRVAVNELSSIQVDDSFGVATSTIKYKKECAQ